MTAEEILESKGCNGYVQGEVFGEFYYERPEIIEAMKEYAKLKCKELLEIVLEKAKIIDEDNDTYEQPHVFYCQGEEYRTWVDKDSVLNAVNLDDFIK